MSEATKEKDLTEEFENLPKSIGYYDIKEKISEGEFSKVYLGISKYTNDKVAIKIINKLSFMKSPDDIILVKNEIEVLKILKHRNILTLYEIYESNKYIFIITEYLSQELITILLNKKRLSESDAQMLFIQLVDAFQYMHKLQICHRDFRLEHIMLDSNNIPKIIDFGFSSFYKKGEELEEPVGSLSYACPEIIQQQKYEPELADVWSLGVTLYVMVCGYLPFSEEDDKKNNELIIAGKVEYPSEIGNICKDLLKKMLEVDQKKRINLLKISRHPWIKGCKEIKIIGGYNIYDMVYPIDERLVNIIKQYDIDTKKLEEDLKNNKYNNITALFKLLIKKTLSLGYGTISDFTSNAFVEYMKNKDKVISDGEEKYKEYLNKIQEKNNELNKNVSLYKLKQENVIKQLEELKNTSMKEENNEKEKNDVNNKDNNINDKTKKRNDFIRKLTKNFEEDAEEMNKENDKYKNDKRKNSLTKLNIINEDINQDFGQKGIKSRNNKNYFGGRKSQGYAYRRIVKPRLRRTSFNPAQIELFSRKPLTKEGKEENKSIEKKEEKKTEDNIIKSINSNNEEKKEIKTVKSEENYEKDEKSENNEEEKEKKNTKEMRYSISFDDDEDKEKSDNDSNNDNNKSDEEKSNKSNESNEQEKEISIKENKEEEIEIKKEEEKPVEITENKEIIKKEKVKKIIKFEKDVCDFNRVKINNNDYLVNKIDEIENARIKMEEEHNKENIKEKEKEKIDLIQEKNLEIKEKIINKKKEKDSVINTELKETSPTEAKETLPDKEKEKEVIKVEENLQSDVQTIEENEDYLRKQKEKMSEKKKGGKEKREKKENEEGEQIKENQKDENNLINLKPKKTVFKNNKQNKKNKEKNVKNNEENENINIKEKKEEDINYLISKTKKASHKKSDKQSSDHDKNNKEEIIVNHNNEKEGSQEKINNKNKEIDNKERTLLRSNKHHKRKGKENMNEKKNNNIQRRINEQENEEVNNKYDFNYIHNKNLLSIKDKIRTKKNENEIQEEKETEKKHKKENNSLKKRSIDLDKKLQEKYNNINNTEKNPKQKEKSKKHETISQLKEKQENQSKKRIHSKNKNNRNISPNKDNQQMTQSQKSRNKLSVNRNKEKEESNDLIDKKGSTFQSPKSISNNTNNSNIKKIIEKKEQNQKQYLSISTKVLKTKNNSSLTISHVNDINYFGDKNNYFYLKNRVLRFNNNNNYLKDNNKREEYKDNNEQIGNNIYINTEVEKKRRVMFSDDKKYNNDNNDNSIRQRNLEKQKNKLKEELKKSGNINYLPKKINSNNNPINRLNNNEINEEKKQTIKIVNKNQNKNNKTNGKKTILSNKSEKYEKNSNDQNSKLSPLDNINNFELTKDSQPTISVNTKVKNDPLKFITQYYLAKDKLNKITNNKEIIQEENKNKLIEENPKYKNINFLEILKLINEATKNDLENKLSKFKGKQPIQKKINYKNYEHKNKLHSSTINNNDYISPLKMSFNHNLHSAKIIQEYEPNNSNTITEGNNLYNNIYKYNYRTASKKIKYKRIISLNKKRKNRHESFGNAERRLNSCKRMCRVCNKSYRENLETENNASSTLNIKKVSHNYNSVKIRKKILKNYE